MTEEIAHNLKNTIKEITRKNEVIHEKRLQKTLYLAELITLNQYNKRLTTADFKVYLYGPYSKEIHNQFQKLKQNIPTKKTLLNKKIITVLKGKNLKPTSNKKLSNIIQKTINKTKNHQTPSLCDWSKETKPYQKTPYQKTIPLTNFTQKDLKNSINKISKQ